MSDSIDERCKLFDALGIMESTIVIEWMKKAGKPFPHHGNLGIPSNCILDCPYRLYYANNVYCCNREKVDLFIDQLNFQDSYS